MPFDVFWAGYFQLINKYEEKCKYYLFNFHLYCFGQVQCLRKNGKTVTLSRRFQAKGGLFLTFRRVKTLT